jgi:hypothetical protein
MTTIRTAVALGPFSFGGALTLVSEFRDTGRMLCP